jgi:hypothetical protein
MMLLSCPSEAPGPEKERKRTLRLVADDVAVAVVHGLHVVVVAAAADTRDDAASGLPPTGKLSTAWGRKLVDAGADSRLDLQCSVWWSLSKQQKSQLWP